MTAVPHEGLRRGPVRPRAGARVVRPSGSKARAIGDTQLTSGVSASGAAIGSGAPSISAIAGALGTRQVRLVLAGRRIRLGSGAFVLLVLGSLTMTLLVLLYLNTSLAEDSFRLQKIRQASKELTVREQTLSEQLAAAESPIGLEQRARELGMVAAGSPLFLRLSDGKVLGQSEPAQAPAIAAPKKAKKTPEPAAGTDGQGVAGGETPVTGLVGGSAGLVGGETPVTGASGATQGLTGGEVVDPLTGELMLPAPTTAPGGEQVVGIVRGGSQ